MTEKQTTPTQAKVATIDFRMKLGLLVVSLLTIVLLATAALHENVFADWHRIRSDYAKILADKATNDNELAAARDFEVRITQNYVPDLHAVDRCTTCHSGVEDPRMSDQPQPYTTHPGIYLEKHDPAKFGCTVCHQGQGRATATADAHGEVPHWDYPRLRPANVRASCTKCHSEGDLYGEDGLFVRAQGDAPSAALAIIERGRTLMQVSGCKGCHVVNTKGGTLGPDLSGTGNKTHHGYDFSHLHDDTPRRVDIWLEEHFLAPTEVSPGTLMPAVASKEDAEALTAYVLSLRTKEAGRYLYQKDLDESPTDVSGKELYGTYCSACHGTDGRKSAVPGLHSPALNNIDTLAVADDDYVRHIIESGRSGTHMPAWGKGHGNLSRGEIDRIVAYIRSWQAKGARVGDVDVSSGDVDRGGAYYHGHCAGCHGLSGEGGVGNALNSQTFLAVADDRFLAQSIIHGRPGTAMPSWHSLDASVVSDILAYIRAWQPEPPAFEDVVAAMAEVPAAANARTGALIYRQDCSSCHGVTGEGGIGPSLASASFLGAIDDRYLYRAITEGRPGTAMPSWRQLPAHNIGALIAYLRSLAPGARRDLSYKEPPGDPEVGEVHYRNACLGCHGERGVGGFGPQIANPVFLSSASDAALFDWIGQGRPGTIMFGFLPEAQGPLKLTASQIADVIAYLRDVGTHGDLPVVRTGTGDAKNGAELFAGNCASCHGTDGEGASGPQLNNPAFLSTASDGFIAATMVLGRTGTAMLPMVAGHEGLGQIPPSKVVDVVAYIRKWDSSPATWRKTRRVTEMSPRAIASGERKYAQYCAACHGDQGKGVAGDVSGYAPALNNPEFLAAASDGFLLATIARGREGTAMRAFGKGAGGMFQLDAQEMNDIVSFIRTWQ